MNTLQAVEKLKITVRTKYFNVFLKFFTSLYKHERERISDLKIFIDDESPDKSLFGNFLIQTKISHHFVGRRKKIGGLYYHKYFLMLFHSCQFEDFVSFDDDIIFRKTGLFEYLENNMVNDEIFGLSCQTSWNVNHTEDQKPVVSSFFFGSKNIVPTIEDFGRESKNSPGSECNVYYNGIDTYKLYQRYKVHFLNEKINDKLLDNKSSQFVMNDYFIHLGGFSEEFKMENYLNIL